MMDIVIVRIVGEQELQRVPPQPIATVVIDSLDGRKGEKEDGFSGREASDGMSDCCSDRIENEAFDRVVV
jgi:hypothetical protein